MTNARDFEELTPQEAAALRWKAVEAFNTMPDLSPAARKVGIALISLMDNKTRACFPSEQRLAGYLGTHIVTIKSAKKELRRKGLVDWSNPNGPRHLSHYGFNWQLLSERCEQAKAKGSEAMQGRLQGSRTTTNETQRKGSEMTTMEDAQGSEMTTNGDASKVVVSLSQGSGFIRQGSEMTHPMVAVSLPEHCYEHSQLDRTQHITPSRDGGACSQPKAPHLKIVSGEAEAAKAREKAAGEVSDIPDNAFMAKAAQGLISRASRGATPKATGKRERPPYPLRSPDLIMELTEHDDEAYSKLQFLPYAIHRKAEKILERDGPEAAVAFILNVKIPETLQ